MPGGVVANRAAGVLPIQRKLRNVDLALHQVDIDPGNVPVEVFVLGIEVRHVVAAVRHPRVEVLNLPAESGHLGAGVPKPSVEPGNLLADP